jgi:Nse1 non-SMC component of SMC5-6 complex
MSQIFIQALMADPVMRKQRAQRIHQTIVAGSNPLTPDLELQDIENFNNLIILANASLEKADLSCKLVTDPADGTEWLVLVNTNGEGLAEMATYIGFTKESYCRRDCVL